MREQRKENENGKQFAGLKFLEKQTTETERSGRGRT